MADPVNYFELVKNPLIIFIICSIVITVTVLLKKFLEWKNVIIDYFWAAVLITTIAVGIRFGLMNLIPPSIKFPGLNVFLDFIRFIVAAYGLVLVSPIVKKVVKKMQDARSDYNISKKGK